ncbi:MAG: hypothetical protein ACETWM_16725 [Candidatus Lokiarchaeia archaeon]
MNRENEVRITLGVTLLALIFIIVTVLGTITGILSVELLVRRPYELFMFNILVYIKYPCMFYGLSGPVGSAGFEEAEALWTVMAFLSLIFAGLGFPASVGLICMKNWGRKLGIGLGIVSMLFGLFYIFPASQHLLTVSNFFLGIIFGTLLLIFGISVFTYLRGDVKHKFK